jgi:hemoglobin/transferrin/lactoferrin receptor protein
MHTYYKVIILVLCTHILQAQTEGISDSIFLDEVITTVSKNSDAIKNISQQVTSLKANDLKRLQVQNTADALINSGTLFVQKSQQGGGSPVIRGFEANKVLLVVDGIRLNNAIYRGGHLQNVITIDHQSLERIDVLNGSSSTIYGSDALGGVVHMKTIDPTLATGDKNVIQTGRVGVSYASANNGLSLSGMYNYGRKKWGTLLSVTRSDFGDLRMGERINPALGEAYGIRNQYVERINNKDSIVTNKDPYVQKFSGYNQIDILSKTIHHINSQWQQGLNIQYSTSSDIPRYDRLTDPSSTTVLRDAQWYYGPQERLMAAYHIQKNGTGKNSWRSQIYYQKIEESRHNRRVNNNNLTSRVEDLDIVGFTSHVVKYLDKQQLSFGIDGQFNFLRSTAERTQIVTGVKSPADTRYPDGDNTMHQLGAYGSHAYYFNDKMTLNSGLRVGYSTLKSTFVNKSFFPFPYDEATQSSPVVSGSLGLAYRVGPSSKIYSQVNTGFRVPNIDDLGKIFESTNTNLIVPNPDLKPEKTINYEVGSIVTLTKGLRVEAVGYLTQLIDAIVVSDFTFDGKSTIEYNGQMAKVVASQNQAKAQILGGYIGVDYSLTEHLSMVASVNFTQGLVIGDTEDKPLDHIPPTFGKFALSYQKSNWGAQLSSIYNGWKRIEDYSTSGEDNAQYAPKVGMPSWYTIHAKVNYSVNKHFEVMAGIDNILDLQYRYFASGINAAGRNITIGLRMQL